MASSSQGAAGQGEGRHQARDELAAERRRLPVVEIEKNYTFEGPSGRVGLRDLFEGRRQLIVYHFMFDPEWDEGCSSCSFIVDNLGHLAHLHARNTSFVLVSRAALSKIEPFRARMGWTVPWYSSFGSDFNYDFHVTQDEAVAPVEYNYRSKAELIEAGLSYVPAERRAVGPERVPARGRQSLPHVLDLRTRRRGGDWNLQLPRPDAARPPGGGD